jgi:hypothetical protein
VHIIVFQKYKSAIPAWLDEGLANYAADRRNVSYAWLKTQPYRDVSTLVHPFEKARTDESGPYKVGSAVGSGPDRARYHYEASTAVMEMIATHCDIHDLLQLSVGKKLETYLSTYCGINDVNAEFKAWLASH